MKVGTKSLLFGVHQVIIHPITVFIAWWKLYGFPKDPRLWIAFIVHDWGYWGKPNMDGKEGETHVELGARIMSKLFDIDDHVSFDWNDMIYKLKKGTDKYWYYFTLYHSRFYAKANNASISKLCVADKYAFIILPKWFYIFTGTLSGEIKEYMAKGRSGKIWSNKSDWYNNLHSFIKGWIKENNKFN